MKNQKWNGKNESNNSPVRFCAVGCIIGMVISVLCGIIFWSSICWAGFLAFLAGFVCTMDSLE